MSKKIFAKRTLPMALAAVMAMAPVQAVAASNDLGNHWAKKVITEWQDKGLIKGYADGSFKPDNKITRAEFATIMNNALGLDDEDSISFTDVKSSDWFYNAVATAVGEGYAKGYEDGTFKPNATITRAEAAVMIANVAGLEANEAKAADFTDFSAIPAWAKGSVGAVAASGYMSGYPDGSFDATKSITRAEAISSLNRVMNDEAEAPETKAEDVVVTEDDTVIENQTITGNLIIDEAVGDGEVYVNDVVVEGDIIVNGGGDDSIYLKNTKVDGKVAVNKNGVRVHMSGETKVPKMEVSEISVITSEDFNGEVGTIAILADLGTDSKVTINVAAEKVIVEGKASVSIEANVETVELTEGAEGAKIEVAKDATVNTVVADAKVTIAGSGKVETLEANADGITVNKDLSVDQTETASGVSKPATGTGSGSSGGGGGRDTLLYTTDLTL